MKKEELRIGNVFPSLDGNGIAQVQELGEYMANIGGSWIPYSALFPIELNEEWLKRSPDRVKEWKGNGADYQPETSKTSQRYYRLDEEIHLVFQTWSWRKNEEDEWNNEESVFINYWDKEISLAKQEVHWAQNVLFYLTGHELEIK